MVLLDFKNKIFKRNMLKYTHDRTSIDRALLNGESGYKLKKQTLMKH